MIRKPLRLIPVIQKVSEACGHDIWIKKEGKGKRIYLLLADKTALSPWTGVSSSPTRNVTSHKSGIARISFMLSQTMAGLQTFIASDLISQDLAKSVSMSHDESESPLLSCDDIDSISQVSVDSYPDEESVKQFEQEMVNVPTVFV